MRVFYHGSFFLSIETEEKLFHRMILCIQMSVILHNSPLTFGSGACKIDSVWCTLAVEVSTGTSVSLITGDSSRGMRFVPAGVFVMIVHQPGPTLADCHT